MGFKSKETTYEPLVSDEARFSQSSDSLENQEGKPMLRRSFQRSSRLGSWAKASGTALAVLNTLLLISIIVVLSLSQHEKECSEVQCAAKTSYYCKR